MPVFDTLLSGNDPTGKRFSSTETDSGKPSFRIHSLRQPGPPDTLDEALPEFQRRPSRPKPATPVQNNRTHMLRDIVSSENYTPLY